MKKYSLDEIQVERVEGCLTWLQENSDKYETVQSIDSLVSDLGLLVQAMAFVNEQMAKSKRVFNDAKTHAYNQIRFQLKAVGETFSPMLAKDYVNSSCVDEAYAYDVCERCSRTITHTIDALRTCVSALKEETKNLNYA